MGSLPETLHTSPTNHDCTVIGVLLLPAPLHAMAVVILNRIETASSIQGLAFAHGRGQGYAECLKLTLILTGGESIYLIAIYQGAHDKRLGQLQADAFARSII